MRQQNKIIIRALAGLANKLRAMESAVSLAKDIGCPVQVIWATGKDMIASYRDLFQDSELFTLIDHDNYKYCRSTFSSSGYKRTVFRLINSFYDVDMAFNDLDISAKVRPGLFDLADAVRGKSIFIDTCHDFYPYRYNFSWVKPLPEIADAIEGFSENIKGRNCIGLHIRRTDNIASIQQSPDSLFEKAIRKELSRDQDSIFFLATDEKETEAHFIRTFGPEKILVYPKHFGRDSVSAIKDAVIDWTILGKCSKLYCSFMSSFSETAASVAKTEAITLKILS